MVIVLMGVSGCGKTAVGEKLAEELGWPFHDGDDHHPRRNVEKMRRSIPLTDADRRPWLAALGRMIGGWLERGEDAILACSALSRRSRSVLGTGRRGVALVHLSGSRELIAQRLAERQHRYMPADLLDSQFAALEPPTGGEAVTVDIGAGVADVAAEVRRRLGL